MDYTAFSTALQQELIDNNVDADVISERFGELGQETINDGGAVYNQTVEVEVYSGDDYDVRDAIWKAAQRSYTLIDDIIKDESRYGEVLYTIYARY